jgi:hypothetical protein
VVGLTQIPLMTNVVPGNDLKGPQISFPDRLTCVSKATPSISTESTVTILPDIESARVSTSQDGGAKAWMTVLGAFTALFCTYGQMSAFGTFQAWYEGHQFQHLPPSAIAWIGSLQLFIFFLSVSIPRRTCQYHADRVASGSTNRPCI